MFHCTLLKFSIHVLLVRTEVVCLPYCLLLIAYISLLVKYSNTNGIKDDIKIVTQKNYLVKCMLTPQLSHPYSMCSMNNPIVDLILPDWYNYLHSFVKAFC